MSSGDPFWSWELIGNAKSGWCFICRNACEFKNLKQQNIDNLWVSYVYNYR